MQNRRVFADGVFAGHHADIIGAQIEVLTQGVERAAKDVALVDRARIPVDTFWLIDATLLRVAGSDEAQLIRADLGAGDADPRTRLTARTNEAALVDRAQVSVFAVGVARTRPDLGRALARRGITRIGRTSISVVRANDGCVHTTRRRVTGVNCAGVAIATVGRLVRAEAMTGVRRARIPIVAIIEALTAPPHEVERMIPDVRLCGFLSDRDRVKAVHVAWWEVADIDLVAVR